ncbi:helix-turn-helix domain-containing protein [Cylindrospermum sp. FACHB-282]|uniref:helix-turn-helix domain-containing protein n=1 Tax=Cylindrospermum sp. FACHB-282 TaxID=2692794 RepID=UPI001688D628|nr:helix-turn-helix domain-containing protein [Cylindrospermum sp. FACHB-282]MBD2385073.1 helix-turn-helix domain-containing protein [Cylindrospermum sp. FACHB-282]
MSDYQSDVEIREPSNLADNGKVLTPFQRKLLEKNLQEDYPESYRQRIEIMLLADEGKTQTEICQILGCCAATARHWIHIARTGMAHQWQDCPIGRPKTVNEEYLERLKELVGSSPRDHGYSFRRWTANWLQKHLAREFGVEVSDRHIKRLLKQMGLSTRAKTSNAPQNSLKSNKEAKIFIADLTTANPPDYSEFLPINFAKLAKDSDIYGAQSVRSVSISATNQQYFRVFTDPRRISALSSTT